MSSRLSDSILLNGKWQRWHSRLRYKMDGSHAIFSWVAFFWGSHSACCRNVAVQSLRHVWLFKTPWTDSRIPDFPILHYLLEFAQNHDHWIRDAIQPSHPQWPPTPPALNLSQHQGLFQWIGTSHQVVKILELQLQHQSFQWIFGLISFRIDWFDLLEVQGTLKSLLQYYNYQLFGAQPSLWSNSYIHRRLLEKP